jgi:hypothetical protein
LVFDATEDCWRNQIDGKKYGRFPHRAPAEHPKLAEEADPDEFSLDDYLAYVADEAAFARYVAHEREACVV